MSDIGQYGAIQADDIEALNYVVWPWDLVMRQISARPIRADLQFLQLDGILINRERWSSRVLMYPLYPPPNRPDIEIPWKTPIHRQF